MLTDTSEFKANGGKPTDRPEAEYFDWTSEDSSLAIHMNLEAVDGIARDVLEGLGSSPRRDCEVGGLLLGRVTGTGNTVWVERFQRIPCEYGFGPHFILTAKDTSGLEDAATKIFETRELAVVGLYRSHTRPGLQLEESDFDLIRKYFSDPSDLILLVKPAKGNNLFGQFYRYDASGDTTPVGERFPFRGRVVTPDTRLVTPDTARTIPPPPRPENKPDDREKTRAQEKVQAPPTPSGRRLAPDFAMPPVEPSPSLFGLSDPHPAEVRRRPSVATEERKPDAKKWLVPLLAALVLVGAIAWFLLGQGKVGGTAGSGSPVADANTRPLGLYVDPMGATWRVLWNTNATALQNARNVQLFVREGDDQNRIDLSARDLAAGSYDYHPIGGDVTFRLEVATRNGAVSAESFRLMQSAGAGESAKTTAGALNLPAPGVPQPNGGRAPSAVTPEASSRVVPPKPTYRAPPVVAAGIRPRIKGSVPVDVRVRIDERGRVVSATPITKLHDGLEEYLGSRAVAAAKLWRFEPARENGKPAQGTQTIHFVFTK